MSEEKKAAGQSLNTVFEKVYNAAINKDEIALAKATRNSSIDECWIGSYYLSASAKLASEGKKDAAEFLIKHGSIISYVAYGAAMVGHRKYAEELLRRGASINYVAMGAAIGGHLEFVKELLHRGADINLVAQHFNKNLFKTEQCKLKFISLFRSDLIPRLVIAINSNDNQIIINQDMQERAIAISDIMHKVNVSFEAALSKTNKDLAGIFTILTAMLLFNHKKYKIVNKDIPEALWLNIFKFFFSPIIADGELKSLALYGSRNAFFKSLERCSHCKIAIDLKKSLDGATSLQGFKSVITSEVENKNEDGLNALLNRWDSKKP